MAWKTILAPHDLSASPNHATAIARDEAKRDGGTLVLLHVIELPYQLNPTP
jgi:nucleotide-binding universal stress UspA family protein